MITTVKNLHLVSSFSKSLLHQEIIKPLDINQKPS